jgi:hypothetical protein
VTAAVELLVSLKARGFRLDAAGRKLIVSPGQRLTDGDRAAIRQHVGELIAHLEDEHEWTEERAGILEFDAGMTRADAERLAHELFARLRLRRGEPA